MSEVSQEYMAQPRFSRGAIRALRFESEVYLVSLLKEISLLMIHSKCQTIMNKDLLLVQRIFGEAE